MPIERVNVAAYRVPTDFPESDGTLEWDSTTLVVVDVDGGDTLGQGYTYADESTARLIQTRLADAVRILSGDLQMRRNFANRAFQRARECFNAHRMTDNYIQLYRKVASQQAWAA